MTPDMSGTVDTRLDPSVVESVRQLPSVASVDEAYFLYLRLDSPRSVAVFADTGHVPRYPLIEGSLPSDDVPPGEAIVGSGLARRLQLRAGSIVSVPTSAGSEDLRVRAIWEENSAVGRSLMVNPTDFRQFWGDQSPIFLAARPAPGTTVEQLKAELEHALGDRALVYTPSDYSVVVERALSGILDPFWRVQQTLLVVVALATFVLLVLFGLQKVRQQAILQSIGMRPSQLIAVSCTSVVLIGFVGAVLGALSGLIAAQAARWNGVFVVGTTPPFTAPGLATAVAVVVATLSVLLGAILPSTLAVRRDIASRLRYE